MDPMTMLGATVLLWLIAVAYQVVDVVTVRRERREPDADVAWRRSRHAWIISMLAPVAVALVLAIDYAAHLVADGEWFAGGALLIALTAIAAAAAFIAARASRRTVDGFARFTIELGGLRGTRVPKDRVAAMRVRLSELDSRRFDVRERVRASVWLRSVPAAIGAVVVAMGVWCVVGGVLAVWWALPLVLLPILSVMLARDATKQSLAAIVTRHTRMENERTEAVKQLEELERRAQRGGSGFSERVSRALQILREQQGPETRRHPNR